MRKFIAHTDLTSPEKYKAMMNFTKGITMEQSQELNQTYGCIKHLGNFKVNLDVSGIFELEDDYGNTLYIAKENKKEQVFDMIDTNDFQLCSSLEEFEYIIKTTFKRKM